MAAWLLVNRVRPGNINRALCSFSRASNNPRPNGGAPSNFGSQSGRITTRPALQDTHSYLRKPGGRFFSSVEYAALEVSGLLALASTAYYKSHYKDYSIYNTLQKGTNIADIATVQPNEEVKRTKEQQKIRNLIDADEAMFGVIVGPTGSGKTHLTRQACCEPHTPGVLYHEIGDATSFPQELAKTIGMRLKSSFNVLDLLIWLFISERYVSYHTLPTDPEESMHYVLNTLAETSRKFKKKGDRVPCLVIDGVDILARKNKDLFIKLVDEAKGYANDEKLYLVLASSEGRIMPLIYKTSSQTRMAEVVQILDVDDIDAIKYLTARGLSDKVAKCVVKHVGGRFVHLKKAVEMRKSHLDLDEDELCNRIITHLQRLYVHPGWMEMNHHIDAAKTIIQRLLDQPETPYQIIDPQELCKKLKGDKLKEMDATKKCMVHNNLLRYDADANLTWHSRLVQGALRDEFSSNT